ncbi:MAG: PDZ domain-containing protein [Proteobacteria bacterium]|nr:PDZ domain-containing protein [Pseudomonadota bacterium]
MKQLTDEPAQFEGAIEVTFPTAAALDAIRIVAKNNSVAFNLRPAGGGIQLAAQRFREATRLLHLLGLVLEDQQNGGGLLIAKVTEGSPAAVAGVKVGDRLLAVDGTALAIPSDLAGVSLKSSHRFELVSLQGTIREVVLKFGPSAHLDKDEFMAIVLSSIALGLFLAFAAPTSRRLTPLNTTSVDPLIKAIGFGVVSILILLVPAGAMLSRAGFGTSVLLLGLNVLGLTSIALFAKGTPLSRITAFFAHVLPVPAMMTVAGASSSAVGLWNIVAIQGAAPWGWHAWSSPFALALVFAAVALMWPSSPLNIENRRVGSIGSWIAAIPAAAMLTACCLGGWLIPGVPANRMTESGLVLAAGCIVFSAKTWTVLFIARWFAATGIVERRSHRGKHHLGLRFIALAMAAILALGWLWIDLPIVFRIVGQVLATAASVTFFTALTILGLKRVSQSFGRV